MSGDPLISNCDRRSVAVIAKRSYGPYVEITCDDQSELEAVSGQFYMLATAARWGSQSARPYLSRAFSLMRTTETKKLQFLFHHVGPATELLCDVDVGEQLLILGPLGRGWELPEDSSRRQLLVGGGVGIAPLVALRDDLIDANAESDLIGLLGFRDREAAKASVLLEPNLIATDDGSIGYHGRVTELLEIELAKGDECDVYACGPPAMLEAVAQICRGAGIDAQLALECPMACGFGACFGCVVKTDRGFERVCLEGPVMAASRLLPGAIDGSEGDG